VYSMGEKYSKFRGKGTISFDDETLTVRGKRIHSPMLLRGFIVLLLSATMVTIFRTNYLYYPLLLVSYYLVQFVILKKEALVLKWGQIGKFEVNSKKNTIAFSIDNCPSCSPVFFKSPDFDEIAFVFQKNIPQRERTSRGLTALEQRYDEQISSMARVIDKLFDRK
jgi:hypothetical protein